MSGEFLCAAAPIGSVPIGGHRFMLAGLVFHHNKGQAHMNVLRQATAVDVLVGPFLNDIDGNTKQTGLTIAAADVLLSKNGQALTLKTDVTACAHDAAGNYNCELDATDTDTVGTLVLTVHVSDALSVRHEFQIIEEAVYDERFAAGASGVITGNAIQISGSATAANNLELSTLAIVTGIATGTPTTTTMPASALTEATDDHYVGAVIVWTSGVAKDIRAPISDYDGTTKTFTFPTTVTACAAADTFIII